MIKLHQGRSWKVQFDSLQDMVSWLDSTPTTWRCQASKEQGASQTWDLGAGYDGALKLAREGWEDGVKSILANISALPNKARAERVYSLAGDFADAPRAASGDPFSMVRRGNAHRQRPVMTIAVNTIASSGTRADVLAKFGAALVAVIDRLENKGVRVELWGGASFDIYGTQCRVTWLVKGAGDAADLSAIAFGIGHPAMMRRLSFAAIERSPAQETSTYGSCGSLGRSGFVDIAPDALCIEGVGTMFYRGQNKSMADMVKIAEEQLNRASRAMCGEDIAELEV